MFQIIHAVMTFVDKTITELKSNRIDFSLIELSAKI